MNPDFHNSFRFRFTIALLLAGAMFLCSTRACGQCVGPDCELGSCSSSVVPVMFGTPAGTTAGVYVGTIGGRGVTLTCQHVAEDGIRSAAGAQALEVTFDRNGYDLAAIFTEPLDAPAATIGPPPSAGDVLSITGYPWGRFGTHSGRMGMRMNPDAGRPWGDIEIRVASQPGDSGGAVRNSHSELVGILSDTATDGGPNGGPSCLAVPTEAIAEFIRRLEIKFEGPQNVQETEPAEPGAGPMRLPLVPVERIEPAPQPPATPPEDQAEPFRVPLLEWIKPPIAGIADTGMAALEPLASEVPDLLTVLLPGILAAAGVAGVSTPVGWGAVVAYRVYRRYRARKKEGDLATVSGFPSSAASVPRDTTEAVQFLRLSQLEGRSPVHDALVGRLAFDELDKIIAASPAGPEGDWARALKRALEDRFNDMAPTAIMTDVTAPS